MKESLKMARFDYFLTGGSMLPSAIVLLLIALVFMSVFSPNCSAFILFNIPISLVPLQQTDKKNSGKMYGTIPVHRKSVTRGRFLYMIISGLVSEIAAMLIAVLAIVININRFLPHDNPLMQLAEKQYSFKSFVPFGIVIGVFVFIMLTSAALEMIGQIFGRENDMRNILIMIISAIVLFFCYLILSYDKGILPCPDEFHAPATLGGKIALCVVLNAVTVGIVALFGEITANIVSKREL
jgi:hypothetical protein